MDHTQPVRCVPRVVASILCTVHTRNVRFTCSVRSLQTSSVTEPNTTTSPVHAPHFPTRTETKITKASSAVLRSLFGPYLGVGPILGSITLSGSSSQSRRSDADAPGATEDSVGVGSRCQYDLQDDPNVIVHRVPPCHTPSSQNKVQRSSTKLLIQPCLVIWAGGCMAGGSVGLYELLFFCVEGFETFTSRL